MTRHDQTERRERNYRRNIRLATVVTLVLITAVFLAVTPSETKPYKLRRDAEVVVIQPTNTNIYEPPKPPPPFRPKQLVPDPQGKATDSSVGRNDWNDTATTRRDPPSLDPVPWHMVEVKPQPLHLEVPDYPEACRVVGIEGMVAVKALVDTMGGVSNVEVVGSSGNSLLDEAAKSAAWKCRFSPGYQHSRPVPVWVAIPFRFRLQ